ncbi:MAG: hypothetical protein RBU21_21010 [FCB group bacterium]|jgi:hypothetical protein|nr:hypothetical protein [FCB group bacterium]
MKRYRVIAFDFDSRAYFLREHIETEWEQRVRENWIENRNKIMQGLIAEFGEIAYPMKINNFIEMGLKPFSVVAFHNRFFDQARKAFVVGAYYPALTGVCALGERILNHLVLCLREHFRSTSEYKRVYRKASFDAWDLPIGVLEAWGVLQPDTVARFHALKTIRNDNIHFRYETDYNDRQYALQAITEMTEIIKCQFAAEGPLPWFIPRTKGTVYIKKEWETHPFIREVYLPSCVLVGPRHRMEHRNGHWSVVDDEEYEDREITDEEFVSLTGKIGQA